MPQGGFICTNSLLHSMNGWKTLFLSLVFAAVLSVGLTYVLVPSFVAPSPDGSLNQSPILYVFVILGIIVLASLFHFFTNRPDSEKSFQFWLFICVAFSGIMIGGVIHEFTHVMLISHPTQFRVHFGDSSAILSTCCLNPGEWDQEILAYLIQFVVTLGWILAFRELFFPPIKEAKVPKETHAHKYKHEEETDDTLVDAEEDPEWDQARKESERLIRKAQHGHEGYGSMKELEDLHHLRIPKRG